jgi:hypothetical protein
MHDTYTLLHCMVLQRCSHQQRVVCSKVQLTNGSGASWVIGGKGELTGGNIMREVQIRAVSDISLDDGAVPFATVAGLFTCRGHSLAMFRITSAWPLYLENDTGLPYCSAVKSNTVVGAASEPERNTNVSVCTSGAAVACMALTSRQQERT